VVVVTGYAIGFNGLPFVGASVAVADMPMAATLGLCLAGLLPGGGPDLAAGPRRPHPPQVHLSRPAPGRDPVHQGVVAAGPTSEPRRVARSVRRPARKVTASTSPSRACWNMKPGSRPARTRPTCSAGWSSGMRPRAW
jgi:hypothetical protein